MGVFTLALDTLAGSPQTGVTAAVGGLTTFIQQWQGKVGNTTAFFLLLGLAAFMQISRSLLEFFRAGRYRLSPVLARGRFQKTHLSPVS